MRILTFYGIVKFIYKSDKTFLETGTPIPFMYNVIFPSLSEFTFFVGF